jgi:hypothetical protein
MAGVVRGFKLVTLAYGAVAGRGTDRFAVGSTHHVEGDVVLCKNGFHFSPEPLMCLLHAKTPADGFRLMVVEADAADVVRSDCGTKYAARTLRVVDEVADADANAALTGTIVQGVERRSHKSGRLHQTSDDAPALQVATTDVTVWTWYQNGMCSRCDGNPNLPTRVVRFIHNGNAGVNQYYWLDGDGAIFRADGPAYLRLVGDTILEAQWASPSDDDGVANIRFEPTINIVHVNYRDTSAYSSLQLHVYGGGSAAVVEWRDVDTARKKTATLEVRDNGDVTLYRANSSDESVKAVVWRFVENAELLTVAHWTALLDSYRPPAGAISVT